MRPGHEAGHSPPTNVEVNKMWIYTSTPPYAFMAQCLVKHRDNFTLHPYYFKNGKGLFLPVSPTTSQRAYEPRHEDVWREYRTNSLKSELQHKMVASEAACFRFAPENGAPVPIRYT
jgi:hypothetical protein